MQIEGFSDASAILRAGVYVLAHKGTVVYVGKSKSMYSRIYTHRNLWNQRRLGKNSNYPAWLPQSVKGMLFDEVHVRPCMLEDLDRIERELICRYRPQHNIVHKPREAVATVVALHISGVRLEAKVFAKVGLERRI